MESDWPPLSASDAKALVTHVKNGLLKELQESNGVLPLRGTIETHGQACVDWLIGTGHAVTEGNWLYRPSPSASDSGGHPLASLLDRAGNVFSLASEFCWSFAHSTFDKLVQSLGELRDQIQKPPEGFGEIAKMLENTARNAKEFRELQDKGAGSESMYVYHEVFRAIASHGRRAIERARRTDGPLDFVDGIAAETGPPEPLPIGETPTRAHVLEICDRRVAMLDDSVLRDRLVLISMVMQHEHSSILKMQLAPFEALIRRDMCDIPDFPLRPNPVDCAFVAAGQIMQRLPTLANIDNATRDDLNQLPELLESMRPRKCNHCGEDFVAEFPGDTWCDSCKSNLGKLGEVRTKLLLYWHYGESVRVSNRADYDNFCFVFKNLFGVTPEGAAADWTKNTQLRASEDIPPTWKEFEMLCRRRLRAAGVPEVELDEKFARTPIADAVQWLLEDDNAPMMSGLGGQSEETGKVEQPPERPDSGGLSRQEKTKRLETLGPASRKAYFAFLYAEAMCEKRLEDREAWEYLRETGIEGENLGELKDYSPPDKLGTFQRYLGEARKVTCEQKYTRRAGRPHGGSIVPEQSI